MWYVGQYSKFTITNADVNIDFFLLEIQQDVENVVWLTCVFFH